MTDEALRDELILIRATVEEIGRRLGVELPPSPDYVASDNGGAS